MTAAATSIATLPVVRALLDEARRKNYTAGALGIRARPEWAGPPAFEHQGTPVTVVPCVSSLAVREALRTRGDDRWVVIVTDRDDADLGAGIRSHLLWHRLRTPDPWAAVQIRFAANGLDPALTMAADHRELAAGLLAATPAGGWPPAPGGVLTRTHALGSVARAHLGLDREELEPGVVLTWTARPHTLGRIGDLRSLAGDPLTDAVLDWTASFVGAAAPLLAPLLRRGQARDVVPVGLVLDVLLRSGPAAGADEVQMARDALLRLEPRAGGRGAAPGALSSWAAQAAQVVVPLLRDPAQRPLARQLLATADEVLAELGAVALAERSDVLGSGLTARLVRLADCLLAAVRDEPSGPPDAPVVERSSLGAVEAAWDAVCRHELAGGDRRVDAFRAAVRLTRWLSLDVGQAEAGDLAVLHRRHLDVDAWVDSAVNDAAPGVGDPTLAIALDAVLAQVRTRRDRHDAEFAQALADYTRDDRPGTPGAVRLEDLLATVVLPLAYRAPVLFLVLDGMSVAVGNEIVESVTADASEGWIEHLPEGAARRIGAVSVLPSLTEVSRASLLSGELVVGQQTVEQRGYAELVRAHRLPSAALFHKKPIDSSRPGYAVADDVGAAIDDQAGRPLVTCILNTIDDALDRSDPVGTEWTADAVKNLRPLMERARLAGRVVVLTSDHGHIVERRQGRQQSHPDISSGRSRPDGTVGEGEVRVAGRRVLKHDGRAVLAVDERLRYGPLKAGYHGGAAPAEVVIPVYFLAPGAQSEALQLTPAPPQEPEWWSDSVVAAPPAAETPRAPRPGRARPPGPSDAPTLFDEVDEPTQPEPEPAAAVDQLAAAVIFSRAYTEQRGIAGRVTVTDDQVRRLLETLLGRPDRRLSRTAAAVALGVAPVALRGAVLHVQRLLNIEGYAVLRFDVDGSTVVLDEPLLREQFEVGT